MKYINQLEYPHIPYITGLLLEGEAKEKGRTTTVSTSGCGLCTAVMIADRLLPNCAFGLEDALELSYACGANGYKGTTYTVFAPVFAEKLGLRLEMTCNPQRLRYCLETGGAAALHTKGNQEGHIGVFSTVGHWVTAIGVEPDGRIAVLDPAYKEGRYDREGRKGLVEVKHGVIALCALDTIVEDTKAADPCFYLFWRT